MRTLIVINPQKGWLHEATQDALSLSLSIMDLFEVRIVSQFFNDKKSLFEPIMNWSRFRSPEDTDLLPGFAEKTEQIVKQTGFGFLHESLIDFFRQHDIKEAYISGVFTDVSIAKTAMDLFDKGIRPIIIADACATLHGKDVHQASIKSFKLALGNNQVITSAEL